MLIFKQKLYLWKEYTALWKFKIKIKYGENNY